MIYGQIVMNFWSFIRELTGHLIRYRLTLTPPHPTRAVLQKVWSSRCTLSQVQIFFPQSWSITHCGRMATSSRLTSVADCSPSLAASSLVRRYLLVCKTHCFFPPTLRGGCFNLHLYCLPPHPLIHDWHACVRMALLTSLQSTLYSICSSPKIVKFKKKSFLGGRGLQLHIFSK